MSTTELYSATLSALTDARLKMLSPEWQAELDQQDAPTRLAASKALLRVEQAILSMSNAILADIAADMQNNEQGLTDATKALAAALDDISKVQTVINTVTSLVSVVAKILPLL